MVPQSSLSKAQFNLGVMYEDGCGVAKNDTLAHYWYKKAAPLQLIMEFCERGSLDTFLKSVTRTD